MTQEQKILLDNFAAPAVTFGQQHKNGTLRKQKV